MRAGQIDDASYVMAFGRIAHTDPIPIFFLKKKKIYLDK
jgi:hypothetical protein